MLKVSPDGTRVATMRRDSATLGAHIWVTDLARDTSIKLTLDPNRGDSQAVWSPDGKRVAWQGVREGSSEFYVKSADGSGAEQVLFKFDTMPPVLTDWTADGRFLVFSRANDIFALPVGEGSESNRQPIPVVQGPATELGAYVSPDSRWIAYLSNESGRQEIYVQPFTPSWKAAGLSAPSGKWLVSNKGSLGLARWRGDGKELLFAAADGTLMAVDVMLSPTFKAGVPQPLFRFPSEFLAQTRTPGSIADVSRDHQRIFVLMPAPEARQGINVILNWPSLLK
jgi:Tol biopolymer transport system component